MENIKNNLDIEKRQQDLRLGQLKEEKLRGDLIPVTVISLIFSTYAQSILTAQKDGMENLLTIHEVSELFNVTRQFKSKEDLVHFKLSAKTILLSQAMQTSGVSQNEQLGSMHLKQTFLSHL